MRKGIFCCKLFNFFFNLVFLLPNSSLLVICVNFVNGIGNMQDGNMKIKNNKKPA